MLCFDEQRIVLVSTTTSKSHWIVAVLSMEHYLWVYKTGSLWYLTGTWFSTFQAHRDNICSSFLCRTQSCEECTIWEWCKLEKSFIFAVHSFIAWLSIFRSLDANHVSAQSVFWTERFCKEGNEFAAWNVSEYVTCLHARQTPFTLL